MSWRAVGILLVAAIVLRAIAWQARGDLWLDEAWLALNVVDRTFAGLLSPLAENQSAPLVWLWLAKALALLPGPENVALRLPAFLAGLALVPATVFVAARFMRRDFALMAGAFVVASPSLVRYSVEAKPYMFDALVAIGLALLLCRLAERPGDDGRWRHLALALVVAPLASITAVFVAPAVVVTAWSLRPIRRHVRALPWLGGSAILGAVLASAQYLAMLRSTSSAGFMQATWAGRFLAPDPALLVAGLWRAMVELAGATALGVAVDAAPWLAAVLLIAAGAGLAQALRRGPGIALQVLLPLVAVVVASVLHQWPLHPRLLLFVAPWLLVLTAAGLEMAATLLEAGAARLGQLAHFAGVVLIAIGLSISALLPPIPTHMRRVVSAIEAAEDPPDVVWFDRKMVPACEFYTSARGNRRCTVRGEPSLIVGDWIGPSDMGQPGVRHPVVEPVDWAERERARIDSAGGKVTWAAVAPPDDRVAVLARSASDAFRVDTVLSTRGAVILRLVRR